MTPARGYLLESRSPCGSWLAIEIFSGHNAYDEARDAMAVWQQTHPGVLVRMTGVPVQTGVA